jgi:MoaA/NifB/PqqE/SkfB family radical SAM enzyme
MYDGRDMLDAFQRGARLGRRLLRANVGRLSYPLKLNWSLTYWCQYKCKTCNIWQRRPTDELTTAEIVAFVRQNPAVSWLDVTGGEIFLRKDISDIFDAIVDTWHDLFILHFPTNGFQTREIVGAAERLARSRVPHLVVTVSVDGNEALNDEVRGIKGGFRRQIETFNALRAISRIRPVIGLTLSRFNAGRVEETFDAVRAACPGLEIGDFHVNFAQVSEHYYGNAGDPIVAPRDVAARELRWYRNTRAREYSAAAWVEGRFLSGLERFLESGRTPMPCHSLRSSCFIDPWGVVFPCITYTRPLGRLRDTGMRLAPIWNAAATTTTQREIWNGDCPQCWTACEAYHSILGNLARPFRTRDEPGTLPIASRL